MRKNYKFILPVIIFVIASCSGSKKIQTTKDSPNVDPVRLSIDTITLSPKDTIGHDSTKTITDTLSITTQIKKDTTTSDSSLFIADSTRITGDTVSITSIQADTTIKWTLPDTITIIGTGDIMPGTNYPDNRYLPPDCKQLFRPVKDILQSADITFGNLEGVFCASGGTPKKCKDPSVCYVFRMPDAYLECILDAGYNLLSVANNHVNDFGPEGRQKSAELLDSAGVQFAGFLSRPYTIYTVDSIRYGFAAFAPNIGTASFKDYNGAVKIVEHLDKQCDIVIVSFHGGAEGRDYQHVPCTDEVYLGYNRGNVCKFSHMVVDAGADIVFGHGPHVTRAMELYNNRLICYSLGNFCTYARFNLSGPNGIAPIVKVFTDAKGEFLGGEIISTYQPGQGGPRIDHQNRALKKLIELSGTDFPNNKLGISDNGELYKK